MSQQSIRKSENKIESEYQHAPIKRSIKTTDKPIRLCQEAIVTNYNDQNEMKKINIQELQSEHRKLNESMMNGLSMLRKDPNYEHVARYFLNSLFCQSNPQLLLPVHSDYLDKILTRIEKLVQEETTLLRVYLGVCRSELL